MDIHAIVAETILPFNNPPSTHVLLTGPECGGNNRVPLFCFGQKSRATQLCCVDIGIVHHGILKVVIEIEDRGNIGPFKIGGKLLPVALSEFVCHPACPKAAVAPEGVLLIQVVNTASLKPATRKYAQYANLKHSISNLLPIGVVSRYELLAGAVSDFSHSGDKARYIEQIISEALGHPKTNHAAAKI